MRFVKRKTQENILFTTLYLDSYSRPTRGCRIKNTFENDWKSRGAPIHKYQTLYPSMYRGFFVIVNMLLQPRLCSRDYGVKDTKCRWFFLWPLISEARLSICLKQIFYSFHILPQPFGKNFILLKFPWVEN